LRGHDAKIKEEERQRGGRIRTEEQREKEYEIKNKKEVGGKYYIIYLLVAYSKRPVTEVEQSKT
jgi:hypothetical protein